MLVPCNTALTVSEILLPCLDLFLGFKKLGFYTRVIQILCFSFNTMPCLIHSLIHSFVLRNLALSIYKNTSYRMNFCCFTPDLHSLVFLLSTST